MNKMKYTLGIFLILLCTQAAKAQMETPVHWSFGIKKLAKGIVEVHLLATIDEGWHIYAQKQSADAVAMPTKVEITKQPGLILIGTPAEIGKKEVYTIKEAGITNQEYAGKVDFVQKVKIKPVIKEIKGTVSFQACTHEQCLGENNQSFTIPIP